MNHRLRIAQLGDLESMRQIYLPYVTQTTVTFEYVPPSADEFAARFNRISAQFPWIVCEEADTVIGYAYADVCFSPRAAYQWDADLSIYLSPSSTHQGIGQWLYRSLIDLLARMGYRNVYGLITGENEISRRFHEKLGFHCAGKMTSAGFKFGRWLDVYWYEKAISAHTAPLSPPIRFDRMAPDEIEYLMTLFELIYGKGEIN